MNKDSLATSLAHLILKLEQLAESTREAGDRHLYGKFLAATAIIIAKVLEAQPIGNDIDSMERLFGNTWFKDKDAYRQAYGEWNSFKSLLMKSICGMTLNERLSSLGLFEKFDEAVAKKDEPTLRAVLLKCFLDNDTIETIIEDEIG
jgi:hypothetical protein